jgi:uncharacterized protein YqjF (DUF2071 family)
MEAGTALLGTCPFEIERPVMRQRWERLTFLHWAFEPAEVARLLPDGLTPDLHDGKAWVGLVPFYMVVATSGGRTAPWVSRFPETNVRTYVRDSDGHVGIWFFSLDAARFGAVAVARTTYRLPYYWSAMDVSGDDAALAKGDDPLRTPASIAYRCYRRWPGPGTASSRVRVNIGDPYQPGELTEFDHFLTARWILFSAAGSRYRLARARHDPWPLRRAEATVVNDTLVRAAGLPVPQGDPLVHYSPGVDVTIGAPERCAGLP